VDLNYLFSEERVPTLSRISSKLVDSPLNKRVINYYGLTDDPRYAFYILPDGDLLDGSGTNLKESRALDHRNVSFFIKKKDKSFTRKMWYFMLRSGCVRCDFNSGFFESVNVPNSYQIRTIVEGGNSSIQIEIRDKNMEKRGYKEFTDPTRMEVENFCTSILLGTENEVEEEFENKGGSSLLRLIL